MMDSFPPSIQFRKPWRSYQQRVLSELEDHLDDRHLHIIAAPGSGKTVLGLEVMRRLNHPALILSPTVAIRDQWVDRFVGLFMEHTNGVPDWISKDIRHPRFLTVSTYQGLHSVYTGDQESHADQEPRPGARVAGKEELLKQLKQLGVRTLVLDEAHHLRNEWWKCLADVKKSLGKPTVVSLTATAPFDVSPFEWERYIGLCGPIDAEISVPELVAQKNLCPHQDYVYMSAPLRAERQEISAFRKDVDEFVQALCANEEFIKALESHPCVSEPRTCTEEILENPQFYSSIAVFLNHVRGRPPRKLLHVIGLSPRKCPRMDLEWLETLLTGCFYTYAKSFADQKGLFHRILRDAKRIGAAERRSVSLRNTTKIARLLIRSASKLKSIEDIVRLENETLGPDLRMVILTDFIRRADFPADEMDTKPVKRLGVIPIFEQIRRSADAAKAPDVTMPEGCQEPRCAEGPVPPAGRADNPAAQRLSGLRTESQTHTMRLGILSGTLTVIPCESGAMLKSLAPGLGVQATDIELKPLPHDGRFCEVAIRGADKHKMVALITALFTRGGVTVLVGTTSLLGEGWDAPSVNSLILASFVGSYMLSNQMRGRAIRTQEGNPAKTANIWHLVCQEEDAKQFNEDMETMARRFKSFVGVSFTGSRIESGLGRLGLGAPPYAKPRMEHINTAMGRKARDRARLTAEWEQALGVASDGAMVEQVAASELALPRDFVFRNTLLALLWQGWFWGISVFSLLMHSPENRIEKMTFRGFLLLLAIVSAIAAFAALPKCLKALWLFLRHGSIAASMRQVGKALLKTMVQADIIETSPGLLRVVAQRQSYGFVGCSLKGGTTRERSVFLEALEELLGPIENPRYVLTRKTALGGLLRKDYHTVPRALGKNKETAEYFRKMWAAHVGPAELVYTRTPEGRRFLLKARAHSMAQSFQRRAERLRSWQ
jgi:superfamily II DNA or RNA helicase